MDLAREQPTSEQKYLSRGTWRKVQTDLGPVDFIAVRIPGTAFSPVIVGNRRAAACADWDGRSLLDGVSKMNRRT